MVEVVGVKFHSNDRIKYFNANNIKCQKGNIIIVNDDRGIRSARVEVANKQVKSCDLLSGLHNVIRLATTDDIKKINQNKVYEKNAAKIFRKKVRANNLEMKLISVEYMHNGDKVIFHFTADERVDFRNLVRDLAAVLHIRIELRQIGVRDETRIMGGLGICGRPFCCSNFLDDFHSVSIKMAKDQGLSLNPSKISGACGRLMCCLKFEQDVYVDMLKHSIKIGSTVKTPEGVGIVVENNLIAQKIMVKMENNPDAAPMSFQAKDVIEIEQTKE